VRLLKIGVVIGSVAVVSTLAASGVFASGSANPNLANTSRQSSSPKEGNVFQARMVSGLSQTTGTVPTDLQVQSTISLADGSVISPPSATDNVAISQSQAMADLVSHGPFAALQFGGAQIPTVQFGLLTSSPTVSLVETGGTPVWVITYQGVTVESLGPKMPIGEVNSSGQVVPVNPSPQVGSFTALINADTGSFIRGIAH